MSHSLLNTLNKDGNECNGNTCKVSCEDDDQNCKEYNELTDLDFFLYKDGYTYYDSNDLAGVSNKYRDPTQGDASQRETGTETISLSSLAAGTYMINIRVYSVGTGANYTLKLNGSQICPN